MVLCCANVFSLPIGESVLLRVSRAYTIWSGLGMSIQGVRTCGDYMFSGHTVALTILNFFITECKYNNKKQSKQPPPNQQINYSCVAIVLFKNKLLQIHRDTFTFYTR